MGNEDMRNGNRFADSVGGLVVLPARLRSTRPSAQSAGKVKKGVRLWLKAPAVRQ